jgi:hypothetical protein
MKKKLFIFSVIILGFTIIHGNEVNVDKSTENSITKDYDQDGVYSSYEKALRRAQESVYVKLPEKRGYWYTILDRVKAEEEELMPEETKRMRRR